MSAGQSLQKSFSSKKEQKLKHPQTESFVVVLSDLHIGKQTPSYNLHAARQTINQLCTTLLRLNELLRPNYSFDEFVLIFLGDILDGSEIYPTQAHHQEVSALTAQATAGAQILLPVIETGLQIAPQVKVYAVAGNHGRSGKSAHEASNWDIVLYQQLEALADLQFPNKVKFSYNAPQVTVADQTTVNYPDTFWLKLIQIRKHYYLLFHGHGTRSTYGIPYYGLMRRAHKWRSAFKERWSVMLVGHFHQFGWIEENDIIVLLSGTMVKDDIWALETLGMRGVNKTWVFGVSDHRPITWQFAVEY